MKIQAEVEWKYEAEEEEKSQRELKEREGKAQAKIKEAAYEEEIHAFKTRKEMRMMSFESISVGCVRQNFQIQMYVFCTYFFKGKSNFEIGDLVEIF